MATVQILPSLPASRIAETWRQLSALGWYVDPMTGQAETNEADHVASHTVQHAEDIGGPTPPTAA